MSPIQAITKEQVAEKIADRAFPDFVIQAFNEFITEAHINKSFSFLQKNVVERIVELGNIQRNVVFENHWLDVEEHYRKAGWDVQYFKPAYNEDPEKAYFVFK